MKHFKDVKERSIKELNKKIHKICDVICEDYECKTCPYKDSICLVKETSDMMMREMKRAASTDDQEEICEHLTNIDKMEQYLRIIMLEEEL